jgi:hypothetical protein
MQRLAARILMLGTALLLALPPGWCCPSPPKSPRKSDAAPPLCCCCYQTQPPEKAPVGPPPLFPPGRSCCQQDADVPGAFKAPLDLQTGVILAIATTKLLDVNPTLSFVASGLQVTSPPLRLLHCVWRC